MYGMAIVSIVISITFREVRILVCNLYAQILGALISYNVQSHSRLHSHNSHVARSRRQSPFENWVLLLKGDPGSC
jgi:hypothetical protein